MNHWSRFQSQFYETPWERTKRQTEARRRRALATAVQLQELARSDQQTDSLTRADLNSNPPHPQEETS